MRLSLSFAQTVLLLVFAVTGLMLVAGCTGPENAPPISGMAAGNASAPRGSGGAMYGLVATGKNATLENVSVSLVSVDNGANYSTITGKDGWYNVSGVPKGVYNLVAEKARYGRSMPQPVLILDGRAFKMDITLNQDCYYYPVNTSTDYVVKAGYNGTMYRGDVTYTVAYPEGATYESYPDAESGLTTIGISEKAGNRVLRWTLNNSKGRYASVQGYIYIHMNGTQTMQLVDKKEMSIADAASSQPGYLGSETTTEQEARAMIDPSNSEIKALAEQIKNKTGSDDSWTVAGAIFAWMKNNTIYYHDAESDRYTQSAIEVLHNRRGDCDELSFLYISMCRAAGIPARFAEGYLVEKKTNETQAGHMWAEFYDGEWVPVELSTSWPDIQAVGKVDHYTMNKEVSTVFGVLQPDHVTEFVDNGTSESIAPKGIGMSYGPRSSFEHYVSYDAVNYNPMYVAACSDGTRRLVLEKG